MITKAIIVDDEKRSRETIFNILKLYCPNVSVIAQAGNIAEAFEQINELHPDVVFLDIEMPGGSGFDLLKKFANPDFSVIFITAYQEFAIKAFKFSAIDYLLKPINPDELIEAVGKVERTLNKSNFKSSFEHFLSNYQNPTKVNKQIVLKTLSEIYLVNINDIVRCESDSNYTSFYLNDGKKIVVSTTIKDYEEMLTPYNFFRVHQSHLINIAHIQHYNKKDGGFLVMKDNSSVPVAVRKKDALLDILLNTQNL